MSQTPGNTIPGAGGFGAGVMHTGGNPMWAYQWGKLVLMTGLGLGVVSLAGSSGLLTSAGLRIGASATKIVTRPLFWAGVNVYEQMPDTASWMRGEEMELDPGWRLRPINPGGLIQTSGRFFRPGTQLFLPIPVPYVDLRPVPSSGGGGPGGIPNLHQPPSIEATGEVLSDLPMAGGKPGSPRPTTSKKGRKRTKCPPGHYWHKGKKKCVRIPEKGWRRASLRYD